MDFDLQLQTAGGRTVIAVSGELDVLTAPRLQERLAEVIDGGERDLWVDLRPTEFIDSSGLSTLVAAQKRLRSLEGDLGLVCPKGNIRRLLEIVSLDQVFTIVDGLDGHDGASSTTTR